jgi:hypothetical protein
MLAQGEIKVAEAQGHPSRAALTSYLGKAELDEYDKPSDPPIALLPEDRILLASDGLFGFLPEEEFAKFLTEDPQPAAEKMVRATIVRQLPYQDNITVAILGYGLPATAPLPDTQPRGKQPRKTSAAKPRTKSPVRKWTTVAAILLALAIAGFIGGWYYGGMGIVFHPHAGVEGKTSGE